MSARQLWAAKLAGRPMPAGSAAPPMRLVKPSYCGVLLGIDPSLRGTGLAVLQCEGEARQLLASETVRLPTHASQPDCLAAISTAIAVLIGQHAVMEAAVEETIYVQNFRTAQIMGMARGAALAAVAGRGLPISEYPPLRIKQAVVGYGRASKGQVQAMTQRLLDLAKPLPEDESDAAAVALCHSMTARVAL